MPSERKIKKLVVANWKMNPASFADALRMFTEIKKGASRMANVQVVICAPDLYLSGLSELVSGHRTVLGAQDCFYERSGAYTGEVSPVQIASLKINYVILGHSERRSLGEADEVVSRKVSAALREGLQVILCVGETERDADGKYFDTIKAQLESALNNIPRRYFLNLIVTYEPVWAISTHATKEENPADFLSVSIFIRKVLAGIAGKEVAGKLPVLYGGSVDERNAGVYISEGGADGLLVGRASLLIDSFLPLIKSVNDAASHT